MYNGLPVRLYVYVRLQQQSVEPYTEMGCNPHVCLVIFWGPPTSWFNHLYTWSWYPACPGWTESQGKFSKHKTKQTGKQYHPWEKKICNWWVPPNQRLIRVTIQEIDSYKCFSSANLNLERKEPCEILPSSLNQVLQMRPGRANFGRILILFQLLPVFQGSRLQAPKREWFLRRLCHGRQNYKGGKIILPLLF